MFGSADPGRSRRAGRVRALLLAAALVLAAALSPAPLAADPVGDLEILVDRASAMVADRSTDTAQLEAERALLVKQRDAALLEQQSQAPEIAELSARIEALGPAPAQGATEAPELAALREQLNDELSAAQAPSVVAGEAVQRANAVIADIDRLVRSRFSAELVARAPSPVLPENWLAGGRELLFRLDSLRERVRGELARPEVRATVARRLPLHLGIAIAGFILAVVVRRRLGAWIDRRLAKGAGRRLTAWIIALRNLNRLLLPAVGATLVLGALDPNALTGGGLPRSMLRLPGAVVVLIVAGWLANSLFSPGAREHRELPLEDREAREGSILTLIGGGLIACAVVLRDLIVAWDLSTTSQALLGFILIPLAAPVLWRMARLLDIMSSFQSAGGKPGAPEPEEATILPKLIRLGTRLLRLIAIATPVLGALGFIPAAAFLGLGAMLTLTLAGIAIVVFLLLNTTAVALLSSPESGGAANGGLVPVFIGTVVVLACLPLAALIWGARPSDILDAVALLRDGVTLGGVRISLNVVVVFASVFLLLYAATRLLQALLRSTVLPRTRLDTGARDALLAGVGYIGYALAAVAGVSAAGVDLSSLAIVAGALSVGIGFGLQTIVSNFVSGIILLVERPIKQGDWIEVGGQAGYVRGIKVRSTEIETFDRASLIVPNSDLIAGMVLNRTHVGMSGRLVVPVSAAYDSDPREVERLLMAVADEHPLILDSPPPAVLFMGMGPDQLDFELRCRLRDVNFNLSVRSDLNFAIVERFRAAGLEFPLPARSRAALVFAEQQAEAGIPAAPGPVAAPIEQKPPQARQTGDGKA